MSKISFVYFDVGGVAIQDFSDSPKWDTMLHDMGLTQFDRAEVDSIYDYYEDEIVLGDRHVDTLLSIYTSRFGITFPIGFSMQKYFLDHFDPNPKLRDLVIKLKETIRVGLLTDQYPDLLDGIFEGGLLTKGDWDAIIDSSILGIRKPMQEIYQIAQDRAGVLPSEILFIDNRKKNLVPATSLGWQTFFYDSKDYEKSNRNLAEFLDLSGK